MKGKMKKILSFTCLLLSAVILSNPVLAQTPSEAPVADELSSPPSDAGETILGATQPASAGPLPPEVLILKKIEDDLKEKYKKEIYIPPSIPSLIFTPIQQSLLREARNGFNTKIPTEIETTVGFGNGDMELRRPINASVRALALSGIVFINPDDWTIWLNKSRVTPDKLPPEALDLRVYKDFIELRWFDARTNQIYPIRLRPNQTFNLDARSFVPG